MTDGTVALRLRGTAVRAPRPLVTFAGDSGATGHPAELNKAIGGTQVEVILLKKVGHLGSLGDKVTIRPGYGRNYLIPGGWAVPATEANRKAFEERRAELERQSGDSLIAAQSRRGQLEGLTVTIVRKAGAEGRLFGSVNAADIARAVQEMGMDLGKQEVRLSQGPLRAAGEHQVPVHLHVDVAATLKVEIIPEG